MTFSPKLKRARKRLGLSQTECAERLGISVRTFQDWEQAKHTPDPFKQTAILDKLKK